jgi:hypothetical protein
MRSTVLCAILGLLFSAVPAWGQMPPPRLKKGEELVPSVRPSIFRATAAEANGEVVVRVTRPSWRITGEGAQTKSVYVWEEWSIPLTLGKNVNAYSQAGKRLSKEAVLKALAKQISVACFERMSPDDPERPDPVYAAVFRDDAVLLVLEPIR